jgi:toxin FitB
MFLLDTNVISELRKAGDGRADPHVTAWVAAHDAREYFLSCITAMELELGVLRIERKDPQQGARLRTWLNDRVLPAFDQRILPIDTTVALQCAKLHVPDPRADRDALIAATALTHGLTVVTRNTADFMATGVPLINPWNPATSQ